MDTTIRSCLLVLTFIAVTGVLYVMRDLITPFALAIFIWLIIDTFALKHCEFYSVSWTRR